MWMSGIPRLAVSAASREGACALTAKAASSSLSARSKPMKLAATNAVEQGGAFHGVVAREQKQAPFGCAADRMAGLANAPHEARNRARRAELTDQIHIADIDAEFERCGCDQGLHSPLVNCPDTSENFKIGAGLHPPFKRRRVMGDPEIGWIAAIIIGGIAGWLAEQFMKSDMGLLMNVVLGIVGAAIASAIFSFFGIALGGWIGYMIAGFVGACLLIWIVGALRGRTA
jgi:uncharacterized membrane protein YeaQ/YmgE (transglycosylase-associated protein family)